MQDKNNFSLSKEGVFYKPSLKDYNKARKEGNYFIRNEIKDVSADTKREIDYLKRQIEEKRRLSKNRILHLRARIKINNRPLSELEFNQLADKIENQLREFANKEVKNA